MMNIRNICYGRRGVATLIVLFCLLTAANAQVPQWRLHPKYSSIQLLGNGYYAVSIDGKYGIMDKNEKVIVDLKYDKLAPFYSNMALLYKNGRYVGYVSDQGRVKEFAPINYDPAEEPRFYEGYLLVRNNTGYYYLRASDDHTFGPYAGGRQFCEGYAVVQVPLNPKKVINGDYTTQMLSAETGELVQLNLGEYGVDDIDFISSVSNGKSIIVLKKRFYEYNFRSGTLTPIHTDGNITNKKTRVMANERPLFLEQVGDKYVATFKLGKMTFDPLMRLASIEFNGQQPKLVDIPKGKQEEKEKSIAFLGEPCAIYYNKEPLREEDQILSPQFDKVADIWKDEALVEQNGKYGVVGIDLSRNFRYMLNDNMPIGFEHKTVNTIIKVVCPPYIDPKKMVLTSQDENCHISPDTRKENTNVESSVLTYQCTLNIPDDIDLKKNSKSTNVSLTYDGLKISPYVIPFDTWYINNYTVDVKHAVESDGLKLNVFVKNKSQDGKYFRNVTLERADSIAAPELTKINEEEYTATIYGWKEGTLRFSVDIEEDGCPTLSYDQQITVGSTKKAEKPVEEPVVTQPKIKRKTVTTSKPKTTPKTNQPVIFY